MALWNLDLPGLTVEVESDTAIPLGYVPLLTLLQEVQKWKERLPLTTLLRFLQDGVDPTLYKLRIEQSDGRLWRQDYFVSPGGSVESVEIEFGTITGRWEYLEYSLVTALRVAFVPLLHPTVGCTRFVATWI